MKRLRLAWALYCGIIVAAVGLVAMLACLILTLGTRDGLEAVEEIWGSLDRRIGE